MSMPPGPLYLIRQLPYFALPSVAVYSLLRPTTALPAWAVFLVTVLARPTLFALARCYQELRNIQDAQINSSRLPPYVRESPFALISKLQESKLNGYPAEIFQQWAEEYGTIFQFDILTSSSVVTFEPEHLKIILATQFHSFEKGAILRGQFDTLLGTGIFNVDGDMWKFHRSITRPFFTQKRISDFEIYDRNCNISLEKARERLGKGYSVDFQDLVSRFTLDSSTELFFGTNVGSLSAVIPHHPLSSPNNEPSCNHPSDVFAKALGEGLIYTILRYSMGANWPLGTDFWKDKVLPMRIIIDEFTEPLIQAALLQHRKRASDGETGVEEQPSLLEHLLGQTQDLQVIKDELVNLLVAGRDTTMALLTFSMYMLTEHPQIEKRLRQEILETVGASKAPTSDQIHNMKYTRAFLNEVLRLYPPVPTNIRASKEPVIFPNANNGHKPFYIPAGTRCFFPIMYIHRRTDLWGPDALEFDPDRFLDSRLQKYLLPNPYIFCPFNAGPRICLGQQVAYYEATLYLVRLLQQFTEFKLDLKLNKRPPAQWKTCKGLKPREKVYTMAHFTLYIKAGLWITMKDIRTVDVSQPSQWD